MIQRAHRAEFAHPVRNADLHALALPVAVRERQDYAQPVLGLPEIADCHPGQLGGAEGAGEA